MDVITAPVRIAIELFESALAEVRFPDVDATTLARSAAEVDAAGRAVSVAQAELDTARSALQERQEALLGQVQRAIAYARVYAENDEELTQRLSAIALPRAARPARSKEESALVLSSSAPESAAAPRRRRRRASAAESEPMLVASMGSEGMSTAGDGDSSVAAGAR